MIWAGLVGGSGFLNFGLPFLRLLSREGSGALDLTCSLTLQGSSPARGLELWVSLATSRFRASHFCFSFSFVFPYRVGVWFHCDLFINALHFAWKIVNPVVIV